LISTRKFNAHKTKVLCLKQRPILSLPEKFKEKEKSASTLDKSYQRLQKPMSCNTMPSSLFEAVMVISRNKKMDLKRKNRKKEKKKTLVSFHLALFRLISSLTTAQPVLAYKHQAHANKYLFAFPSSETFWYAPPLPHYPYPYVCIQLQNMQECFHRKKTQD
jgi:hypothetical protein